MNNSIVATSATPFYSGSCFAVACPAYSTGPNVSSGCTCFPGYQSTIRATINAPLYYTGSWFCVAQNCPTGSTSNTTKLPDCRCNAGYNGTIIATTISPSYYSGVCVDVVCPLPSTGTFPSLIPLPSPITHANMY